MPDYRLRPSIAHLIKWPISVILNLLRAHTRFVFLSPNFCQAQLVYDRLTKKTMTIRIRDTVDYYVAQQVYEREDYSLQRLERRYRDLMNVYRTICTSKQRPLILDLGAHVGYASKYFSREFPEAKIVAVEPDAANVSAARRNLGSEANVTVVCGGVASKSGKGRFLESKWGSWAHRTEHDESGNIELVSIPSILADKELSGCVPFMVKIDIEGFEEDLFACNTE